MTLLLELRRFAMVGLLNTGVGLGIIWLLMWLGVPPRSANVVGFLTGGVVSYQLNRAWTFRSGGGHGVAARFMVMVAGCYLLNLAVLNALLNYSNLSAYVAQVLAVGVYSACFFVLSRFVVFRSS